MLLTPSSAIRGLMLLHEVEVTTKAGLSDLSSFLFEVTGKDTGLFLETLGANTPPDISRIGLIHTSNSKGTVSSEFTVRWEDHAMLTSAAASEEIDADVLSTHAIGLIPQSF